MGVVWAVGYGGTEEERVQAEAVWGVVSRHHWLLCTLLLINAAANEAGPDHTRSLTGSYTASKYNYLRRDPAGCRRPGPHTPFTFQLNSGRFVRTLKAL